jgi:predicted  nucleic acid-binding Zn-ribbon protein
MGANEMQQIIEWGNMSNTEIRMKLSSLEEEYTSIKNKINSLLTQLDELDNEYIKGKREIENRSKI